LVHHWCFSPNDASAPLTSRRARSQLPSSFWSLVYTTFTVPGVFRSSVRSLIGLRRFGLVLSRLELVPSQNRFLAAIGESYSLRPPISAEEVCTGVITPNLIHSVRPCKLLIQFCSCLRASYFPMSDTTDSRFRFFFFSGCGHCFFGVTRMWLCPSSRAKFTRSALFRLGGPG